MPGITGFVGEYAISYDAAPFTELSGEVVKQFQQNKLQLAVTAIKQDIGYNYLETEEHLIILDGDIFSIAGKDADEPLMVILQAHKKGQLSELLATVNGYFCLLIHDKNEDRVQLVSDRFGIKPLYLAYENQELIGFSSEFKALALHPKTKLTIDKDALSVFTELGHMLNQSTWFDEIKRLAPASIITIDTSSGSMETELYWQWGQIEPNSEISFEEATDKLYQVFDQAVGRCMRSIKQPNLAVTLSGGLDSRAILAAATNHFKGKISTYTFGHPSCEDAIIAKRVAEVAGVSNTLRTIDQKNWFEGRDKGIWKTDGMFNVLHMHALGSVPEISQESNYLLNGYVGDAVLGGSLLLEQCEDVPVSKEIAAKKFPGLSQQIVLNPDYFSAKKYDPLFLYNRGVRFTAAGTDLLSGQLHNLKPFMDNDLIEFIYSVPDSYRKKSRLYNAMLLKYYPEYFKDIPWQQTGKPITLQSEESAVPKVTIKRRLINFIKATPFAGIAHIIYRKTIANKGYTSYTDWMQQPEFKAEMNRLLLSDSAPITQLIPVKELEQKLTQFYRTKPNNADSIGSLITLAIYLEQLKKFRSF
ncbi:asparagine synthase-related protein [uncultured Shewanella sp.]|uniref:asparagine synthase-related protein n=1 Tax=uncultured Shewanella sp. TaxID=173975 RepID=UPI00260DD746|nr:asparagine synthase-related protein [uncultured Shewanella sp.]